MGLYLQPNRGYVFFDQSLSSGTTYLAEDLQSGEQVALKALSLRHITDWKAIALFEREAQVLAQLNHPAIPRYLE